MVLKIISVILVVFLPKERVMRCGRKGVIRGDRTFSMREWGVSIDARVAKKAEVKRTIRNQRLFRGLSKYRA